MEAKKLMAHRFEVSRALRMAHHLTRDEVVDPGQAVRDLAQTIATLALAIDQMLETYELEHAEAG